MLAFNTHITNLFFYLLFFSLLFLPLTAQTADTHYCQQYEAIVKQQIMTNQQLNCHFSGLRWAEEMTGHIEWCKEVDQLFAEKELQARNQGLDQCRHDHFALTTPKQGKTLNDFIPNHWELVTQETYFNDKTSQDLFALPILSNTMEHDFDANGQSDIIALIGKRTDNQAIFERFSLLILQANSNGYKKLYQLENGLTDLPPPGVLAISARINIFSDKPNELTMHYWSWFDSNNRHTANEYKFTYINNEFVLSGYASEQVYLNSTTLASYTQRTDYDLIKRQRIVYDDTNTDIEACWEETEGCPEPLKTINKIDPSSIGKRTIDSFKHFKPIDFEKELTIKVLK